MDDQILSLSESLIDEVVGSVGFPKNRFTHQLFKLFFMNIASKLAEIGVPFDRLVASEGLPVASSWCLTRFCDQVQCVGSENILAEGPLLAACNHPGAYDGLVAFSSLRRNDIRWISTEIPFLDLLPSTREHILFTSRTDTHNRMIVLRNAIKHLQSGGALVYFASGHRDPDPAVFRGAEAVIDQWQPIYETFFKYVPQLKVLPVIMSGMVSDKWAHAPLTWLRRKQIDKHRLAEFGQVITQLMHPQKLMLSPTVSIGEAVGERELKEESDGDSLTKAIITRGKQLLHTHCESFGRSYL